MAHVEPRYRCPVCKRLYVSQRVAMSCRNNHPITEEKWAVGKGGKEVRIYDDHHPDSKFGINWALREADLSDFIEERKQQIKELGL